MRVSQYRKAALLATGCCLVLFVAVVVAPTPVLVQSQAASGTLTALGDTAGVVVENEGGLWVEGEAWTVAAEPEMEIGVVAGPAEHQLQRVTAAARQSDGDLVVADGGAATVRLYGSDGSFKALLGGRVPAPGEFRAPTHVLVGPGDSISVWDQADWRLTRFDADGELAGIETVRLEPLMRLIRAPLYPGTAIPMDGGTLLVRLLEKGKERPPEGFSRPGSGAVRVTLAGEVLDTLAMFDDAEIVVLEGPWGPWTARPPLARSALTATQPGGRRVCVGDQSVAEVRCWDTEGVARAIRWTAPPPRVDDGAIAAWRTRTLEELGRKLSPEDARRLLALIPMPEVAPEFSALLLDARGHLWVERGLTALTGPGEREMWVFRPDGHLLGSVIIPAVRVMEIGPDYLLGVREDDLGVQFLGVYPLDRS